MQQSQLQQEKAQIFPLISLIDTNKFGPVVQNSLQQPKQGSYGQVFFTSEYALKIIKILNTPKERQEAKQIIEKEKKTEKNNDFYTKYYNEREMYLYQKWGINNKNTECQFVAQLKSEVQQKSLNGQRYAILPLEKFDYNLLDYLHEKRPSYKQKMKLCKDICRGIKFLHDQKLMHRDINLKNILIKEEQDGFPRAVVADFSLVKNVREVSTRGIGTIIPKEMEQSARPIENSLLTYSQIQQIGDGSLNEVYVPYDESVDLYTLGITLIQMFINSTWIKHTYIEREREEMIKIMRKNYPLQEDFIKLLERCISNNSKTRPKIEEMLKITDKCLQQEDNSKVIQNMRDYQFKIFTKADLETIKDLQSGQQKFIKDGLNQGFQLFNLYLEGGLTDRIVLKDVFDTIYNDFIMKMQYPQKISSGDCLDISEQVPKLYQKVHEEFNKQLTPQEKLFLEFLIGFAVVLRINCICCALLFVNSNLLGDIAKKSIKEEFLDFENIMEREGAKKKYRDQFWNSQYICLKIIQKIQRELFLGENQSLNHQQMEEKWDIIKTLMTRDSQLNGTFQNLCSLRYIPKEEKYFLCFAQILHWRGFGGQGELLPTEDDPYVKELIQYRDLSIRYVRNEASHFGGQQILSNMFIPILKSVQVHYAKFVQFAGKKFFEKNPQKTMRTFDFGSGPTIPALDPLVNIYKDQVEVIASDIDGFSFEGLLENDKAKYVQFLDLNYMQQRGENFGAQKDSRGEIMHKFGDTVDLFTSRLVIHQCMDFTLGHNILPYILNYISYNLVTGGFFAWFDTGPMCYMQAPIIPGNMVDREGCVPTNIFRYLSENDIDKLGVEFGDGYKVMLYIPQVLATSPDVYNLYGGLYMFRSFINVYFKKDEYIVFKDKLKQLNEDQKEKDFNDYVKSLLISKFGSLITEIDQHMNEQ